jgi:hypothetical protein
MKKPTMKLLCFIFLLVLAFPSAATASRTVRLYMPGEFTLYAAPDFGSERIATFKEQYVFVAEINGSGWAQISSHLGRHWIFLKEAEITEAVNALDTYLSRYGGGISVYYKNIGTGYSHAFNGEQEYYSASVIKAPFALYIYDLADKGLTDLAVSDRQELLSRMVNASDNGAFDRLLDIYGNKGFVDFIAGSGGRTEKMYSSHGAMINVFDAAHYAGLIYDYIEKPGANNERLRDDLLTAPREYIKADFPIANKYGMWDGAMHDMAIVYADSPYILVILSDWGSSHGGAASIAKGRAVFGEISAKVQDINNKIDSIERAFEKE